MDFNKRETFPGGEDSLWCYIEKLNYDVINSTNKAGKIYIFLRIDKSGHTQKSVTNPKSMQSSDDILFDSNIENELLRVIKTMPKWEPLILRGKKQSSTRLFSIEIPYINCKCKSNLLINCPQQRV